MYVRILATGTSSRQNHKMKAKRGFERFLKRSRFTGGEAKPTAHSIHSGLQKKYVKVYIHTTAHSIVGVALCYRIGNLTKSSHIFRSEGGI